MNKISNHKKETLANLSHGSRLVSSELEKGQDSLRLRLRSAILQSNQKHRETPEERSPFRSAWLPGPLSYPWLLMFASVPKIIEQLFRAS